MSKNTIDWIFNVTAMNELTGRMFTVNDFRQKTPTFNESAFLAIYKFSVNIKFKRIGYLTKNGIFVSINNK